MVLYLEADRIDEAQELAEDTAKITDPTDILLNIKARLTIGAYYRENEESEKAEKKLLSSLKDSREVGSKIEEGEPLQELISLEKARGEGEKARGYSENLKR